MDHFWQPSHMPTSGNHPTFTYAGGRKFTLPLLAKCSWRPGLLFLETLHVNHQKGDVWSLAAPSFRTATPNRSCFVSKTIQPTKTRCPAIRGTVAALRWPLRMSNGVHSSSTRWGPPAVRGVFHLGCPSDPNLCGVSNHMESIWISWGLKSRSLRASRAVWSVLHRWTGPGSVGGRPNSQTRPERLGGVDSYRSTEWSIRRVVQG